MMSPTNIFVRKCLLSGLLLLTAVGYVLEVHAAQSRDSILILDASGSMWGQIDGVNKIVIAKDVVEGLVLGLPQQQRLGFVAYGHRKEGDCADIETLAGVGAARSDVIAALRQVSPRGKTPLSAAVLHAAEKLNYKKHAADVIVVSDGLENCGVDPCDMARKLEAAGLDFAVHVVGFDVTAQERAGLQCIATETGGQFVTADNAEQLADALRRVAVANEVPVEDEAAEPVPSTLVLKASVLADGPLIHDRLDWRVVRAGSNEVVFEQSDTGAITTAVIPGEYHVEVLWHGWRDGTPKRGEQQVHVRAQMAKVVTVPIDLDLRVSLSAPASTAEGVPFEVSWTGPDDLGAYVQVAAVEDGPRTYIYGHPAQRARDAYAKGADPAAIDTSGDGRFDLSDVATASVGAPSIAGDYEVRYVLDRPRVVLARQALTVTDTAYRVQAPPRVAIADEFEVHWEGTATERDFVTITKAGDDGVFARGFTQSIKPDTATVTLRAPVEPGEYEVRYVLANGYTLYPGMQHVVQASTPIQVLAVSAKVTGPSAATGGDTITLAVEKPDNWQDDIISVVAPGADKFNRDAVGRLFHRGQAQEPVTIQVPNIAGEYELVYILRPGGRILHRQPITISQAPATLEVADVVAPGEDVPVQYTGPAYRGDRVVVVTADTPDSKMWGVTSRYGFVVPTPEGEGMIQGIHIESAGDYEVRYVTGLQHVVLARDRFTVSP